MGRAAKKGTKETKPVKNTQASAKKTEMTEPVPEVTAGKPSRYQRYFPIAGGVILLLGVLGYIFKGQLVSAWVNGKPITRSEYIQTLESQGGQQVLEQLVTEQLIVEAAQKQNVTVAPEEIDAEIATIEGNIKSQGRELNQVLLEQGMTVEDLRHQVLMRKYITALTKDKVQVTDDEVKKYITDHKDELPANLDGKTNVEGMVREQLEQTKQQTAVTEYLAELRQNADIRYW